MPLEVRELIIKAVVDGSQQAISTSSVTSKSGGSDQNEVIQSCVEKVLQILRKEKER